MPSRYIEVSVLGDTNGNLVHLGERDGSLQRNNQKIVEESPAPYLLTTQREQIGRTALALARLFNCHSACTVEFLLDSTGTAYFTGIKPRIQVAHPVAEMRLLVDEVREQICIAAGEPLHLQQADLLPHGHAMQFRINAEDPWNHSLPSPGRLRLFRPPGGPGIRVDTYAYSGCEVPVRYDPLLAKLIVWAENRETCIVRARRALEDFAIIGVQTNLPLMLRILDDQDFVRGDYTTEFCRHPLLTAHASERELRDLAAAAAIAFVWRNQMSRSTLPDRLVSGWHRDSNRLPG